MFRFPLSFLIAAFAILSSRFHIIPHPFCFLVAAEQSPAESPDDCIDVEDPVAAIAAGIEGDYECVEEDKIGMIFK